jgi:hypothetical protein
MACKTSTVPTKQQHASYKTDLQKHEFIEPGFIDPVCPGDLSLSISVAINMREIR